MEKIWFLIVGGIAIFALFKYVPFLNNLLPVIGFIVGILVLLSALKIAKTGIDKGEKEIIKSINSLGKDKANKIYCADTFKENESND